MSDKRKDYQERDEGFLGYPHMNDPAIREVFEPWFDDKRNYNTNAPSYYDYLARINKLMKILGERIWDYDKELAKRFEEWDKNLEEFPEEVKDLLIEWLEDGTLEKIINENIFNDLNEKIDKKFSILDYYDEYVITDHRDEISNTSYMIAKIPQKDKNGDNIEIKVSDDRDLKNKQFEKTSELARRKQATLAINASPHSGANNTNDRLTILNQGVQRRTDNDETWENYILAWDKNRNFRSFSPNTTTAQIKEEGYTSAIPGFMPLISGGKDIVPSGTEDLDPAPRTAIAQDYEGNVLFFVSSGRLIGEFGMKTKDAVRVLIDNHHVKWAHMLDGGGSTTMVNYHQVVNRISGAYSGDRGSTEREVGNMIYIGKDKVNKQGTNVLDKIARNNEVFMKQDKYLQSLMYTKTNHIQLKHFCVNGWEPVSEYGQNAPRLWIMPNNTIYFRGAIKRGKGASVKNTVFIQLPYEIHPYFKSNHICLGSEKGELYNVYIGLDGKMEWLFWDDRNERDNGDDDFYIRLDGIFTIIGFTGDEDKGEIRTQSIQKAWLPYPLEKYR